MVRAGGRVLGSSERSLSLSTLGGVIVFVSWPYRGAWAPSRISGLSSEPPNKERGYSGAGQEFPFQPVCARRADPRKLQIWDFAGSLPVVGSLAPWDTRSGASSATLPGAMGLPRVKRGFWQVANPLISSEALAVRWGGINPKHSCFRVGFE